MKSPIELPTDKLAQEKGYHYDHAEGQKVIDFANKFFRSEFRAPPFSLLQYQEDFLRTLYGHVDDQGHRRFQTAIITMAKKVFPPDCKG